MSHRDETMTCEEVSSRIEAWLDREAEGATPLPGEEARRLRHHLNACRRCAAELTLGKRVRDELQALGERRCPDRVVEAALEELRGHQERGPAPQRPSVARRSAARRALLAAAALAALAFTGWLVGGRRADGPPAMTAAELHRAELEARLAFAYVAAVTRQAGLELRDTVFEERVVSPVSRAVSRSLATAARPGLRSSPEARLAPQP